MQSHARPGYRLPGLLQDICMLDLLELSGNTVRAGQLLNLSQPTISRRYRILAKEFSLKRDLGSIHHCRYGSTPAIQLLRLSCRAHRLSAGFARIGADPLHQHLLARCNWLLPVPSLFRSIQAWGELLDQGVLDGALLCGLEVEAQPTLPANDFRLFEIGNIRVVLAVTAATGQDRPINKVLVPHRGAARGLSQLLLSHGLSLRPVPSSCSDVRQWLQRLDCSGTAMPVDPFSQTGEGWAQRLQLRPLPGDRALSSSVWLLLPRGHDMPAPLARTLEALLGHPALNSQGQPGPRRRWPGQTEVWADGWGPWGRA